MFVVFWDSFVRLKKWIISCLDTAFVDGIQLLSGVELKILICAVTDVEQNRRLAMAIKLGVFHCIKFLVQKIRVNQISVNLSTCKYNVFYKITRTVAIFSHPIFHNVAFN